MHTSLLDERSVIKDKERKVKWASSCSAWIDMVGPPLLVEAMLLTPLASTYFSCQAYKCSLVGLTPKRT